MGVEREPLLTGYGCVCDDELGSYGKDGPTCQWGVFEIWREVLVRVGCRPWIGCERHKCAGSSRRVGGGGEEGN